MGQSCAGCICKNKTDEYIVSNEKINTDANMPKIRGNNRYYNKEFINDTLLIKLQNTIKGRLFRRKYNKKSAIIEDCKLINTIVKKYITTHLSSIESSYHIYNLDRIKKLFKNDNLYMRYNQSFRKELIFKTKCLIYNNNLYIGEVNLSSKPHGQGTLYYITGVVYKGEFNNGENTGHGRKIDEAGILYEGFFINGSIEGLGKKSKTNNSYYQGYFINNIKEGEGKEETSEFIYEGSFINDIKEGKGRIYYKDKKDSYEGEFKNNMINGLGTYCWANTNIFNGYFKDGKMHGKGIYKWPDGSEYEGEYINNLKEGLGKFKWTDNKIYVGPFNNGKPHGDGCMLIDGLSHSITFNEGKVISNSRESIK
jgi:hypothetical protein